MTASGLDPAHRFRLALGGEIDIATAPGAVAGVIDARPSPGDVVTLDMSEVSFIDSTGISMLLSVNEYLHGIGCQLAIANPSAPLMRVLAMVGLSEHFPIESTELGAKQ